MTAMVDSSVWINHMRGNTTSAVQRFRRMLQEKSRLLLTADLIVLELVRGCRSDREASRVKNTLLQFQCETLGGVSEALRAAQLNRKLRASGTTVAKTVDLLIASWCIHEGVALLHDDADFRAFERHGLHCL